MAADPDAVALAVERLGPLTDEQAERVAALLSLVPVEGGGNQ